MTLNEDTDYVRAIDFSEEQGTLFSISDNGFARLWDIEKAKLI
jgi:WD40 repeat protein